MKGFHTKFERSLFNVLGPKLPIHRIQSDSALKSLFRFIPTVWVALGLCLIVLISVYSNGTLSILLSVTSIISLFSWILVAHNVFVNESVFGLSKNMMLGYCIITLARVSTIVKRGSGYLPKDGTGEGLYQLIEILNLAMCVIIMLYGYYLADTQFGSISETLNIGYLVVPSMLCALVMQSDLNANYVGDCLWAFSLYLEVVVIIPQLCYFRANRIIDVNMTHFLAAQTVGKLLFIIFWYFAYPELNVPKTVGHLRYVGNFIFATQLLQILIASDFMIQYVWCWWIGKSMHDQLLDNVV